MKSKFWVLITLLMIASMVLAACAPKTVIQTVEVQKIVEVTPTPAPLGQVKITIFVGFGTGTSPSSKLFISRSKICTTARIQIFRSNS